MNAANTSRSNPGGQAGMRGYLVQTLIALLDGLKDGHPFVRVTLEPDHESEKIDILWEYAQAHRAVQVKSSINQFAKADVQKWAEGLKAQNAETDCELCLVGLFHPALANLDQVVNVKLVKLNNDPPAFREQAAHRLDGFLRAQNLPCGTGKYREMLADALTAHLATLSTTGEPLSRDGLTELLRAWVAETPETPKESASVSPMRLRHGAEHLVGREKELARLDAAWHDPKTHVVTIVAWGGVGKTALVVEWMARMARDGWSGAERVFDWSFYSQGTREQGAPSSDTFIAAALEFFGGDEGRKLATSPASPWDKGARLAQFVAQGRTLLVLDGVEPLQYSPGAMGGRLKDPALEALLKGLAQQNLGLCIVTTRESVEDLAPFRGTTSPQWTLDHLSIDAGAEVLSRMGVTRAGNAQIRADDKELKEAAREVDGHALTLQLLGRYIAKAHNGDIRKRNLVRFAKADAKVQGGHAFKVMAAYEKWLAQGDEDGPRQLAVLRLLGLFDRPADAGCLAALREEPVIADLTEPLVGLRDDDWNYTLSNLVECGLISVHADQATIPDPQPTVDCHPIIRDYSGERLRETHPEAWREAHRRLYEHLTRSTEYQPKTLEGLEPLYEGAAHGCQAGMKQQVLNEVLLKRIWRKSRADELEFFATKKLGAIGADLAVVWHFFERPWDHPSDELDIRSKALVLHAAGFRLRVRADWNNATVALRLAQETYTQLEDWKQAADCAGNLNEICIATGDLSKAKGHARESVELADCGDAGDAQWHRRAGYARVLHLTGDWPDAERMFCEAERMLQGRRENTKWLYSLAGFYYCDFLLDRVGNAKTPDDQERLREVKTRALRALRRAKKPDDRYLRDIALHGLILGRVHLLGTTLHRARVKSVVGRYLDQAVNVSRDAGRDDHRCEALLARAAMHEQTGNLPGAEKDIDEAWQIANRGSMWLYKADIHLYRARLFRDKSELTRAGELIRKLGYRRRDEELADTEEAAKNW